MGLRHITSYRANTRMRGYDSPSVFKLLQVHSAVAHYRLVGVWESDRPPGQGKREVRLQQPDLDAFRLYETHTSAALVPAKVGIMKLLPTVKLLRIHDHQQSWRFPVHLEVSVDVVGIPTVEHFEQDTIDLLLIRRKA